MKKMFVFIALMLFVYVKVVAQLGYRYNNQLITLKSARKGTYYIQAKSFDGKETGIINQLKTRTDTNATLLAELSTGYLVSLNAKPDTTLCYLSDFYEDENGTKLIVQPRITMKLKEGQSVARIKKLYHDIMVLDTCMYDVYRWQCKLNTSEEVLRLALVLSEEDEIEWCEPVKTSQISSYDNPLYFQQYYLWNYGQTGGTAGIDINVRSAWDITKGSSEIVVAVIDNGVDLSHEDLSGNIVQGYTVGNATGHGAPQNTNNDDCKGHGTACAGIIAAEDNNIGIIGVASNVKILPVNIAPNYANHLYNYSGFASDEDIADAIRWAYERADVLSNSWGGGAYSSNIVSAINDARIYGRNGKGTVVVFSSGNNLSNPYSVMFPANVDGVITVGAIDKYGNIWNYSCRGTSMDLVAPSGNVNSEGDVVTTDCTGTQGYSNGNYTFSFGGTSAACPQVAGVAALMLSARPDLTETQVRTTLQQTAKDLGATGFDTTYGYGLVDAEAAVNAVALKIIGPSLVCTDTPYYIENLPAGMSVVWTLENLYGGFLFHTDTPSSNQCTLGKVGGNFHAILKASIYNNSSLFATTTKKVYSLSADYGTYTQESCWYNGVQHPAITTKSLKSGEAMFVHQGCMVTLHSSYFERGTVSHSGATPDVWYFNPQNKTLIFSLPLYSGGIPFMIDVHNDNSCGDVRFTFFSVTNNGNISSNSLFAEPKDNGYLISITRTSRSDKSVLSNNLSKNSWEFEIYNANWGTKKLRQILHENKFYLDTSGWDAGIYVIRAVVDGEVYTEKISVK